MPSTKEIPEVGTIYLYEDVGQAKSRTSCCPWFQFFRKKLNLDKEEIEHKRQAIMKKDGHYRVRYTGLNGYRRRYFHDFYITLVDLKWRYAMAIFFNIYLISFFIFGVLWWICAYNHGDFQNIDTPNWEPCVSSVYSFPKCLLFSIETQTTIGYGVAYPNTDCDGTLFLVYLQITIGILLDNLLLGFIFVKFAQPKRRQNTVIFSKNACVTHHDGELAIQVRVGDIRKSHLLAAQVHGVLIRRHVTIEGVLYPIYMTKVDFTADDMDDTVVLMWPMILTHKIDKNSPFWDVKPADLNNEKYELIIYIEGTIETTGEFCQVRTSYTPRELLWGHRFDRIEEFDSGNARWEIDFASFNDVVYTSNIRHSAKELAAFRNTAAISEYEEVSKKKEVPINTISMKTVSYDTRPKLPPPRYSLEKKIKFDMPQNDSQVQLLENADGSSDSDGRGEEGVLTKTDSAMSLDEKGFQTADEEGTYEVDITDPHTKTMCTIPMPVVIRDLLV